MPKNTALPKRSKVVGEVTSASSASLRRGTALQQCQLLFYFGNDTAEKPLRPTGLQADSTYLEKLAIP
ncbi:hypothetical protein DPMN_154925 [Dreissena polymorpha]|uniref:Uncharacterized protein n=1 Tax=Dreissena polymorpha TaxID=45954 RepID=A0A9D4JAW4_DREPO|nr:hypothetical protein DPMN_154925 [Dreissena polymorpha]